jgi:tRNA (cytidine/uridine-2'-O-)-methyltransferase
MTAPPTKLRMPRPRSRFHVVLVEPEIPQNTGNIARLCGATGSALHLVGRLGFQVDDKAVRRAGLDYWHLVDVYRHPDLDAFIEEFAPPAIFALSTKGARSYTDAPFAPGSALVFGRETKGLPAAITERFADRLYGIPTVADSVRSLNLANATAIVLYEALRTTGALDGAVLG